MKYFIMLIAMAIIGCSNDDDTSGTPSGLEGEWNLVTISGGFIGVEENFEQGEVVWDFDESSNMVTITTNIEDTSIYSLKESGTYPYYISAPADAEELFIDDRSLGIFTLGSSFFTLDESAIDGFKHRFER
ncbi:hypothetical protein GCM10022393_26290 [Aquimarina addita]|uniref:Lipocalin-like domain-containing protein n=1 Tax=Aquimarina addita TaxID=870485 RepID=A0ABP6UL97_9FLAO